MLFYIRCQQEADGIAFKSVSPQGFFLKLEFFFATAVSGLLLIDLNLHPHFYKATLFQYCCLKELCK